MATIRHEFLADEARFGSSGFPQLLKVNGTNFPVFGLYFDAATDEHCFFDLMFHDYGSGSVTVTVEWYADNATTGNVVWEAYVCAITPNTDTESVEAAAFDTVSYVQDAHLGTTSTRSHECAITVNTTELDGAVSGDRMVLKIARDANSTNATDDMANDAVLEKVIVTYSDT